MRPSRPGPPQDSPIGVLFIGERITDELPAAVLRGRLTRNTDLGDKLRKYSEQIKRGEPAHRRAGA